ncbi:zinc ABC transporter substrate-binding protein [Mesobacterium pallidum]|uniref:zinc ABC transporter substrate-binding protein n=1 Tax=Mesobacterium pallidum TaxID=2872037 RepID=UPI001EE2F0D3|nr:zinc ABC transporter substrate-binding protein [Mesobacterium pallidum]
MIRPALISLSLLGATAALADVPRVATDIPPVTSLVAQVMDGLGAPESFLPASADPHHVTLRPSEAQALAGADLVVWIGPGLMPGVAESLPALAGDARVLELSAAQGTERLPFRQRADFGAGHDDHDAHGDHADEGHEDHGDEDGHDYGDTDPHAWLAPANAAVWLQVIAEELSTLDPENAATYATNAAAAQARLAEAVETATADLADIPSHDIAVDHDAFQYFERAFDLHAVLTVTTTDDAQPGPREMAEIQERLANAGIACLLVESEASARQLRTLGGGEIGFVVADPMGGWLDVPVADLYPAMITSLAGQLAACGK